MVDWPLRSVPEPPTDRSQLPEYLDGLAVQLGDEIALRLNRVVRRAYNRFLDSLPTDSLTATGDYAPFSDIALEWQAVLNEELLPMVGNVYVGSSVSAVIVAADKTGLPAQLANDLIGLMSNNAIEYAQGRVPQLVGIGQSVAEDVTRKVAAAIEQGVDPARLRREIQQLTNVSRYRADAIARTEVGIAWGTADYETSRELAAAGFGPVEKVWRTTFDGRARTSHENANGQRVKFDEAFVVGADQLRYPSDPLGSAAEIVNCRCYMDEYFAGDTRDDGSIVT